MDEDFRLDISQIFRQIKTAEVISIFFPLLGKSLLIDTRYDVEDDPLVRIVPMARNPEERLRRLQRMRPHFPRPNRLALIPWSHSSGSLQRLGIVDRITERLAAAGRKEALENLKGSLQDLAILEREELAKAISGEQYHTLWASKRG